jgi:uncharacterized protein YjbI with pentapeptide repeats
MKPGKNLSYKRSFSTHVGLCLLLGGMVGLGCEAPPGDEPAIEESVQLLSGDNLGGSNLAGSNLAGSNLAGTNLGGANLGGSNLAGSNLGGSNLAGTNLGGNNLAGSNMAGSNLAGSNLAGSNLAGSNLAGSNLAGSNLAGSNLAGSNLAGNDISGTNLGSGNLVGATTGSNIYGIPGAVTGMLYSGEDLRPRTSQCVVMGIGSTAFAKLLGQQSASSRIYTAVGKLPWGFASSSGGSTVLDAWEAVVWGDTTYCVFIVTAPRQTTTWAGVAGFIKAIFRWTAPPGQSMDISGIEASGVYDATRSTSIYTYTGMMGTAAKFRAGLIPPKNYLAGELAFVSATTNNIAVKVDFASWIVDYQAKGMVLGNVEPSLPAPYAEAVYSALENTDGTVQIAVGPGAAVIDPRLLVVSDNNFQLVFAWAAYTQYGLKKPVPRRCAGALFLKAQYNQPVAAGKCDTGVVWSDLTSSLPGVAKWSTVSGTTAPMNSYMLMDSPTTNTVFQRKVGYVYKTVLSETYTHLWEKNYD